jgi:hypothetical protein
MRRRTVLFAVLPVCFAASLAAQLRCIIRPSGEESAITRLEPGQRVDERSGDNAPIEGRKQCSSLVCVGHYSALRARIGSIEAARRAGMKPATEALSARSRIAPEKAQGL